MSIKINHILLMAVLTVCAIFMLSDTEGTFLARAEAPIYLLILISIVSIVINIQFKSAFLEILNIVFVIFYICRIPFIIDASVVSDVILRNVNPDVIPSTILVLAFQYVSLIACILLVNPKIPRHNLGDISESTVRKILKYSFLIIFVNLINYFFFWSLGITMLNSIFSILSAIFPITSVLSMLSLLLFYADNNIISKYRNIILVYFVTIILVIMYTGSKSGVLQVLLALFLAIMVIYGTSFKISLKFFIVTIIAAVSSFILFSLGIGFNLYQRGQIVIDEIPALLVQSLDEISVLFAGVSYRIGYLDFFIQKYSNDIYKSVVSLDNYFKAIIDALTPGFDVFYVELVKGAIYTVYYGDSMSSNSELITVFAESHMLFGYFSFFAYLLILIVIKQMLKKIKSSYSFGCYMFYFYIISFFYVWLSGMGIDYTVTHAIVYNGIFVTFSIWILRPTTKSPTAPIVANSYDSHKLLMASSNINNGLVFWRLP